MNQHGRALLPCPSSKVLWTLNIQFKASVSLFQRGQIDVAPILLTPLAPSASAFPGLLWHRYRDATGRRIDVSLRRQEARAAEQAKLAAEKKEREAAMGDVQLRQRAEAKAQLEEAKFMKFERTAEDEDSIEDSLEIGSGRGNRDETTR